MFYKAN